MSRISRRRFLAAGATLAAPLAFAQPRAKPFRLVFLAGSARTALNRQIDAFERGLRDQGYMVGQDVIVEFRSTDRA